MLMVSMFLSLNQVAVWLLLMCTDVRIYCVKILKTNESTNNSNELTSETNESTNNTNKLTSKTNESTNNTNELTSKTN